MNAIIEHYSFMCFFLLCDTNCSNELLLIIFFIYSSYKIQCADTHFFVGQFFATTLLANLMTFIVTAWCTIAAVVFLLTTDAFTAAFTFLFRLYWVRTYKKRTKNKWLNEWMLRSIGSNHRIVFNWTRIQCTFFLLLLFTIVKNILSLEIFK